MTWLTGQVALVTGGGSGLGRAIVERFVEEGARVGVLELSADKAEGLRTDLGGAVAVVSGDATDYRDNEAAVAATVAAFGKLDAFIGNAAIWDFGTSLAAMPAAVMDGAFREVFDLNVKGYLHGAKASLPALLDSAGSMIFTASNAAFWPGGGGPLYTASKHAVVGLVRQLAYELAPRVRVNGVAPGGMATDLRGPKSLGLDGTPLTSLIRPDMMRTFNALGIAPEPRDYTGHYVLLASRQNNRTVTGTVHNCDAGVGVRRFVRPDTDQKAERDAGT
jgi:NAD(P)-dependent dehydrogenase (short-subunit alcohol dehydrogenase family)